MTEHDRQNRILKAWLTPNNEGCCGLIDRLIPTWLPSLHGRLPCGFKSMEQILAWLERHNQYDVYSFDVFDTLLRRRIDPPELVKQLVAEHISELLARSGTHVSPKEILTHRTRVEEALWRKAESGGKDADYHLDDVVAETLKAIKAERVLGSEQIVNYEIGLEKKATQPTPVNHYPSTIFFEYYMII